MALHSQLHHKPPPSPLPAAVPCPSTAVVQLLLCFLLLSCSSHPMIKPCTCSAVEPPDPYHNLTVRGAFDQLPGYLFLTNMTTCTTTWQRVAGLASYIKAANQRRPAALDLSQKCWFFVRQNIVLHQQISYGGGADGLQEASFSVSFTMTTYHQPNTVASSSSSSVVFAMEPLYFPMDAWGLFTPPNWQVIGPSSSTPTNSSTTGSDGSRLSAAIGTAQDKGELLYVGDIVWVQIGIEPPPPAPAGNSSSSSPVRATTSKYSVWIDYNHVGHRLSVYVDAGGEGKPKPANAIASKTLNITAQYALLGLLSSMGQLLQVHTWNSTVDALPAGLQSPPLQERAVVLYSVLGSVAAVAVTTALVFLYLNSKYRRWKKEQDELTKIMQGIPGVPTHVGFADIKKATRNFHETMKLGKGGFGAVYRCTLPAGAGASRTRQTTMDVAVKKFMREVDDRRCSDFLAEVSIINRLRHKNIVPLVGWSYNKGEPLLIYEYMTNGSLDQHIFQKSSAKQEEEEGVSDLRQWRTRYGIARDIATGLHYVHHEHEPMVLHRDIKASNIMLDSDFHARLGDFGIACAVAIDRSSVTGIAGTWGYIAPDYAMSYKATRQTDIYAFGVLILEVVTGKKNGDMALTTPDDDDHHDHITDWIWRLHGKGMLLEAVDASVLAACCDGQQQLLGDDDGVADEARRMLLLGLACTNPNPLDRPTMAEVLQVINKVRPPPEVPTEKPSFVWPPQDWRARNSVYSTAGMSSDWDRSSTSTAVDLEQPSLDVAGGQGSVRSRLTSGSRALQS
ncbi:hypothetical protein U9M48_001033 [Paspalum notatum var. saurae]|uniref:Protein kinase domain-containing protein n=1 Tax=Paspalum notatum var. saurae TaxID=547442 RepID=A0AAQ3PNK9_PASNO